ncbi:hypothetical protein TRFO_22877 [Tritrichomonas foetus]|uniref:Uncharacterized protein n=1 Tax=Tritrichomonas foetus TaxID=1144522 RepID=A0A1J4KGT8_9EUKA|nr:hypothetical protein TRFO_22877 [Tritrichomonas foetus]|eukprot:OHT08541.1 hypothetical protein TRFO_22877 [Tritrichomonas foetus]
MTESLNCVFIPTNFYISDVVSIVLYVAEQPNPLPSLSISVDGSSYSLPPPVFANNRLAWEVNTVCDFYEEAPECDSFKLTVGSAAPVDYSLNQLVFLGPTKSAKPPQNIYLLEFVSGVYARSTDYKEDTVSFSIDSILTLDYRNVLSIRQQLEELSAAQKAFEEKKALLTQSGIDLNKLSNLKAQYEDCMREKRRVQHDFEQQNQRMQAATIHSQTENNCKASIQSLTQHIEMNKKKERPAEPTLESYKKLLRFRIAALNELKMIFPFSPNDGRLCTVHYHPQPQNSSQWGEMKAFLGFATHYIREVSRVVGVPLQFNLIPLAGSSRLVCRLTDEKKYIPNEYTSQTAEQAKNYEESLILCAKHIIETLLMEVPKQDGQKAESLMDYLIKLNTISEKDLETLIPKVAA